VLAIGLAVIGFGLFRYRQHMRLVRWGLLGLVVVLHLVMDKPVWHLFGRINLVSGSTGYHRYLLLDAAIHHFGEWWLVGTRSTENWGTGLFDVTNQYLLEGVRGGVWALVLFFVLIGYAFARVGQLVRANRNHRYHAMASWALGVTLVTHCANFMAISYFGQIIMIWYLLLAVIGSLSVEAEFRVPSNVGSVRRRPARPTALVVPGDADRFGVPATTGVIAGRSPSASA
jgi:hypothetical protein